MVEQQMICGRPRIASVAAACIAVIGGSAWAADNPRGFDLNDEDLNRSVTITPRAEPMPPLPLNDNASTPRPQSGNPLWGISIDTLHATRERPLFSPSRRPPMPAVIAAPPPPVAPPPPPPEEPSLNLVGTVAGGSTGDGYAVFLDKTSHDIVSLKTGEGRDGWILQAVSNREAVLEKNKRIAVIRLPSITGDKR
jgi:general secretion pathway protein N